ncbi:MAG: hypothetical protein JW843_01175 [Candidatus Aminicenantes bacterium]|nr:hypothetical protein [Candidatus Aminicenantes bacterium]
MKKRSWRLSVFLVLLAGFAALSFAAPQVQKHKITLENGKIIEGEIVAVTATTISIKDAALGVIAIARENILKIEPPLDAAKPAVSAPAPPPRYADQPVAPRNGAGNITFGFSLSGGMSNINGGDFNEYIVSQNNWYYDMNDYFGEDVFAVDWKEMKWMSQFGGELFARFGKHFGLGLGVEYIKKSNPGSIDASMSDSETDYSPSGYYIVYDNFMSQGVTISQTLSAVPITLSFYGFLPLGPRAEAYVKAGVGYYLGKLTSDWTITFNSEYSQVYYWDSGTLYPPHWFEFAEGTDVYLTETTCNTLGFHFGAGFNFNVSNNIALFGEAFYRMANFKDWQGTETWDWDYQEHWGWSNSASPDPGDLPGSFTDSASDDYSGKLWSFEDIWDYLDTGTYLSYGLYEAGDEPDENAWTKNVRPTEINLNGFTFKAGIKIFFGGRR